MTWQYDQLVPGETITETVTVTVTHKPEGRILMANTAKVYSDEGATDCDSVTTTVIAPDLRIVKTDDPDPVPVGDMLSYTIVVSNAGYATATGVVLTDTLDSNVSYKSADPAHVSHNGAVIWDIGSIAPWETITYTLSVTVSKAAHYSLNNVACVTSLEQSNACDDEPTDILRPELKIIKLDDPDPVGVGQPLTYTIQVMNIGPAKATGVVITDDLDSSVFFQTASHSGTNIGGDPNGLVTWPEVPVLNPGQTITRTLSVTVSDQLSCGATFPNTAHVMGMEWVTDTVTIDTSTGGGTIKVNACEDKDADGMCDRETLPSGILACLTDSSGALFDTCQPVPATFTVDPGKTYTAHLKFTGESQGLYPTVITKTAEVNICESTVITLPAIYPVHPKGVAVHEDTNKVYVAFQGPEIGSNSWPYPFVAVIDSETDQILKTIPGNAAMSPGIGELPWSVVAATDYVYVGSFQNQWVSVIDPNTDKVVSNIGGGGKIPGGFKPAASTRNPHNANQVHFADYGGGGVLVIEGQTVSSYSNISGPPGDPTVFRPFEIAVAEKATVGRNFVTMRDAINTDFEIRAFDTPPPDTPTVIQHDLPIVGSPHALGLWQNHPSGKPYLYTTYADDPPPGATIQGYRNPNKLLVYGYDSGTQNLNLILNKNIDFFEYAEAGLIYNPVTDLMLGTYAGFPYWDDRPYYENWESCMDSKASVRGGMYTIDSSNTIAKGPTPNRVVGNQPITAGNLDWKNPFELAHNPNNDKIYVTDRCWNDWTVYGGTSKIAHGAVLVIKKGLTDTTTESADISAQAPVTTPDTTVLPETFNVADVNRDGVVDVVDLSYIASHYGSNDPTADLNGDGLVDVVDMGIAALNYQ